MKTKTALTNSALAALPSAQRPSVCHVPKRASSAADEAVEIVQMAGIDPDPWEEFVLRESLGERDDEKWAAFECGLLCPRQNGKNEILLMRKLVGLFLLGERLIVHSAHRFDTSQEAFRRLKDVIEDTPRFSRRLKPRGVKHSHGEEGIELKGGQRVRFRTRTKSGGRGFSGDCLIFDEAFDIPEAMHGAIVPILSARPNPQVWYAGTAVDQWRHDQGVVFTRLRERGHTGEDSSLAWFEWGLDVEGGPDAAEPDLLDDPEAWRQANPALGIRISEDYLVHERASLDARSFAVERLGIGDWPPVTSAAEQLIAPEDWRALADPDSVPLDPLCIAFDVTPRRDMASIGVAGVREDGNWHVEMIERKRGTKWVPERLAELQGAHHPQLIRCDGASPAASLIPTLEQMGLEIEVITAREHAQSCGTFYDCTTEGSLRHLGQPEVEAALRGAAQRSLGDAWAWSRRSSAVDISPLVAVTLALGGIVGGPAESVYDREERGLFVLRG